MNKKNLIRSAAIDQQSVFYVFHLVLKEEFGKQGVENIVPVFFSDRKIFIKTAGSNWASEIWLQRKQIVKKINQQLGADEIVDLAMSA